MLVSIGSNLFLMLSAKMEAPENDLPPSVSFRVNGFPTLKFKKAGSREFIDYSGDRSLESLIAFVEENAVNPLDKSVPFGNSTPEPELVVESEQVPLQAEQTEHEYHDEL